MAWQDSTILWFFDKLENGSTTYRVPDIKDLNFRVIAHCIAKALPPGASECSTLFRTAFTIPPGFLPFCSRKNDLYGIHIVRGGTSKVL